MFTTYILACSLIIAGDCTEIRDTRGPYKTEEECAARAEEMVMDLIPFLTSPHGFAFKCEVEKGYAT